MPTTAAVQLVEVTTANGTCLQIKVAPVIAAILRQPDPPLRELPFADVSMRGPDGDIEPLNPDLLDGDIAARRIGQRFISIGNPWEGPRHRFPVLLGYARPGWNGMPCIDERGECGICHGQRLAAYAYCLACDRCGRDASLPTCPAHERPRPIRADGLKGGRG